ncbi:MAG: c-type cytochrome [Acidimicrobiia bacterium]
MQGAAFRRVGLRWGLAVLLIAAFTLVWTSQRTPAAAQSADEGRVIFEASCAPCHTIGGGSLVGPDLEGVTTRREPDWLARWIAEPDVMLAEGDPIAARLLVEFNNVPMPNLGLTDAEVASLVAYLDTAAGEGPTAAAVAESSQVGDPSMGKRLFEGTIRFENGGPPCLACHSIAGIGAFGGGTLGPDLTGAYGKFGEGGIAAIVATTPFPTMKPIFDGRPLTEQEQAQVAAFLKQAAVSERTAATVGQLALLAAAGAALLLLLMRFIWRRRLTEVRRPMVARSHVRIERSRLAKRELQNTTSKAEGR